MVKEQDVSRREFDYSWNAHMREHQLHENAHELEHTMTSEALNKADAALERRLEGMNEFRAQLEKQSGAFLTREVFEQVIKDTNTKTDLALVNHADKYDTIIKAIVNRHEADMDALKDEIQGEREYRKTFEGSINTWKWIATFLGASGLAGVIIMFATRTP